MSTTLKSAAPRVAVNSHAVEPRPVRPLPPGGLINGVHNARVATNLRNTLNSRAMRLAEAFAKPTPMAQAPRKGADGDYYAPNGDRLIKVKRGTSFALVNPNTNECFYPAPIMRCGPGGTQSGFRGPVKLPEGERFKGGPFSAAQVAKFEAEANHKTIGFPIPRCPPFVFEPKPVKPVALR